MLDLLAAIFGYEGDGELSLARDAEISGAVLVTECVTANDDWLGPVWNQARNVRDDDRLAEDNSTEDVADGSIRGLPHFFET